MTAVYHELVLLRHGKAVMHLHCSDIDRDLSETGCERTYNIASYMSAQQLVPDSIISSSAKRAIATANIVCDVFAIDSDIIDVRSGLYIADWHEVLKIVQQIPDTVMRLLLVGHNPAFEVLVEQLVSTAADDVHLSPSSMARLMFEGKWSDLSSGQCQLLSIKHAKELVL